MAVSAVVGANNHMSIFDDALALHQDSLQVTVHFTQFVLDLPEDALALLIFGCEGADDVLDLRQVESNFPKLPVVHDKPEVVLGHDQISDLSSLGEGVAHDGDQHVEQMQHDDNASESVESAQLVIHGGVTHFERVHAVGAPEGELGDEPHPIKVLLKPFALFSSWSQVSD